MELWLMKYSVMFHKHNVACKIKRALFCKFGFHQLYSSGVIETISCRGKEHKTCYVACKNCNVHYFPSKKERDEYLIIKEQRDAHKNRIFEILTEMKNG